ncbi:helix-turn-helix domain-containing protein [Microbacterium rhizophilus]|uniref:helix-turn-helix domain-containing protein n=1 Tax=Microbacterium rhizophilus TaxID=3138934 RepID=UPI0031F115C6
MVEDPARRLVPPAQVAELLGVDVDEVLQLVQDGRLRGARVGSPARWRIEHASVGEYLDAQVEEARRMALWRQSNAASFPELWGTRG